MNRQSTKDFGGHKTNLHDIMMTILHYAFIQTHRMYNTRSES